MNIEDFRAYCLSKKGTTEDLPFDDVTLTFKVMGKIFAITGLDSDDFRVNLKCDPERAIELRETHPDAILPGYHMNKKHWNTVVFENIFDEDLLIQMIDHSYDLVVAKLKKADRAYLLSDEV